MLRARIVPLSAAMLTALSLSSADAAAPRFRATSTDMANGKTMSNEQVLNGFGCMGGNMSPEVKWDNAPANAKSFAITLYDPDAPTGSGWWHWVAIDIPASVHELAKGAGKDKTVALAGGGRQTHTDFGASGYGGPCPPMGDKPHRYILTVYALDTDKLDVPDDATAAFVGFNLHFHTIAKSAITARYGR